MEEKIYSVKPVIDYLECKFDYDKQIKDILILGEIQGKQQRYSNKNQEMIYFDLIEEDYKISCVSEYGRSKVLKDFKNGDKVVVLGDIKLYKKQTKINLVVKKALLDDIGALKKKNEELRKKYENLGYFLNKKQIPKYPNSIGIITSKESAAKEDMLNVFKKTPYIKIKLYDATMQGDKAIEDIRQKLIKADKENHDILILSRGGGSKFDLETYNSEVICKTVYDLKTPIITAIGHSIDEFIVDSIADKSAITPTAAAEMAIKYINKDSIKTTLNNFKKEYKYLINKKIDKKLKDLEIYKIKIEYKNPKEKIKEKLNILKTKKDNIKDLTKSKILNIKEEIKIKEKTNKNLIKNKIINTLNLLNNYKKILEILSPNNTLNRGFSYILKQNKLVDSINKIKTCEDIEIKLKDGVIKAMVKEVKRYE